MASPTLVGLVTAVVACHAAGLFFRVNRRRPVVYTNALLLGYGLATPFVFRTSREWCGLPMQLTVSLLVLVLDWFSFHEDLSRFSEEDHCLFGPSCRENARITGHIAHLADVGTLGLLLYPLVADVQRRVLMAGLAAYAGLGSHFIEHMTGTGSVSDLRGKTTEQKCRQARVMRHAWRGALNDVITVLGVVATWQAIFKYTEPQLASKAFPLSELGNLADDLEYTYRSAGLFAFRIAMIVVPTYANYLNTSYQHGRIDMATYGLPSCFDDPDD